MKRCQRQRRQFGFCILATTMLIVLAACQATGVSLPETTPSITSPTVVPANDAVVTICFATYESAVHWFEVLAEKFHDLNPDIRVEVLSVEQDIDNFTQPYAEMMYRIVSSADTGAWWIDHFATRDGLVHDLAPFIEADASFASEDFFPNMLETFQWGGGTWALPFPTSVGLIYYDRSAFDAAGIPYPQIGWTPEDFLRTAQQLTVRDGEDIVRYGFVDQLGAGRESFILSQVGSLIDDATGQLILDGAAMERTVRWYTDLVLVHGVMLNPEIPADLPASMLIREGRAAMWSATPDTVYGSNMKVHNIGSVSFPVVAEPSNWAMMNGYFMSVGTAHPQESWRWISFLTHQHIEVFSSSLLPARRSVAEQTQYWAQFDDEEGLAIRDAVERLYFVMWDESAWELGKSLPRIFKGEPVREALVEAQTVVQERVKLRAQITPRPVVVAAPETVHNADITTISFAPAVNSQANWSQLAETFRQEYADIRVKIVNPNESGNADCFSGTPFLQDAGRRAQVLNLHPLIESDAAFSLDDVHSRFLDPFRYQGDLWGVPFQAQVYVVYYNRELFDVAGVPYPEPGWTLEDFLSTAQKLTHGSGTERQWGFSPFSSVPTNDLRIFLVAQGVKLWEADGRSRFDAPDVVEAVAWYADLVLKHAVMPVFPEDFPETDLARHRERKILVHQGQVAMWANYTGSDTSMWPVNTEVRMAPLPVGNQGGVTDFSYEGLFINADTPHVAACWEWVKFICAREDTVYNLPAHSHWLVSPVFLDQVGEDAVSTYMASLEYAALPRPSVSEYAQLYWLYQAMGEILDGTLPEAALSRAQRQAQNGDQ